MLHALLTVVHLVHATDPVTQTACRCHESASTSLDFSVENLMAWKRQSESETVRDGTNESEKRAVQFGDDLATIKNYVGSLKDRIV